MILVQTTNFKTFLYMKDGCNVQINLIIKLTLIEIYLLVITYSFGVQNLFYYRVNYCYKMY